MSEGTIAEMMRDYAEAAVELAHDFRVTLDYSESSLEGLEQILAQLHDERHAMVGDPEARRAETGQAPAASAQIEEQMVMMCKLWGGYLGEVVRRRWGGEWAMETYPGADFATLTLNVRGAKLFPSVKIYRRLSEGEPDNVWNFYQRVKEKLG